MAERDKKRQVAKIAVFITSIFVIFMSVTYAFITQTLTGTKQVVINAGVLDLVLEEENEITISDALPMYDEVGMIQEEVYLFKLVNKTANSTNYVLKLQEIQTGTLDKSIVKYGLIKDGKKKIDFVSNIVDGIIDEGIIKGNDTIEYLLRLWIDASVTNEVALVQKSLSFRLNVVASQVKVLPTLPTYASNAGYYKYKSSITSLEFQDTLSPITNAEETWDISQYKDGSLMAYLEKLTTGGYKLYIQADGEIYFPEDSSYLFYYWNGLEEIIGLDNVDT